MSKVLHERGFGSLPSSTETNPRDHVKSILTIVEADTSSICRIGSHQYAVSTRQNSTLMYERKQTTIPFPSRLNDYYCESKKGSYGPQFSKAYLYEASHIDKSIPRKKKDPGSFTLPCYINNVCFDNALAELGASITLPLSRKIMSEDYDEEREIELRPEPNREATSTLRSRSSMVLRERERVVRFEETSNMERSRRGRNAKGVRPTEIEAKNRRVNLPLLLAAHLGRNESCQPLRFSLTSIQGGHQPLTNMQGSLPPNYTLLSHHAQPFIPSSLHTPTRLVPIHVNPLLSTICGPCQWANSEFPFSKPN
ncbi:hypothetical protein Tco_1426755, partial [Tanacetum coccineum]